MSYRLLAAMVVGGIAAFIGGYLTGRFAERAVRPVAQNSPPGSEQQRAQPRSTEWTPKWPPGTDQPYLYGRLIGRHDGRTIPLDLHRSGVTIELWKDGKAAVPTLRFDSALDPQGRFGSAVRPGRYEKIVIASVWPVARDEKLRMDLGSQPVEDERTRRDVTLEEGELFDFGAITVEFARR